MVQSWESTHIPKSGNREFAENFQLQNLIAISIDLLIESRMSANLMIDSCLLAYT